jgi:hypothetical protein
MAVVLVYTCALRDAKVIAGDLAATAIAAE